MGQYIEAPIVFFGIAFLFTSLLMFESRRSLGRVADEAERSRAVDRDHFASKRYVDPIPHRIVLDFASGTVLTLALVGVTGFVAVYYLTLRPLLLPVVLIGAYATLTQIDSVESVFFARFFAKVGGQNLGSRDLEFVSWSDGKLRRGTVAFAVLGVATLFLSLASNQLVAGIAFSVGAYTRFLYAIVGVVSPLSRSLSIVAVATVLAGTFVLAEALWKWTSGWLRKRLTISDGRGVLR